MTTASNAPLGVFDSGIGGLTVVREILRQTPGEEIVYIGDTAHVPYGNRTSEEIRGFSVGIGRYLAERTGCRAVVVACNRATAAGVEAMRDTLTIPVIGMEPGVKPATQATKTGKVGVLATPGTMSGERFASLLERHARAVEVITQPCPGWVEAVEAGDLSGPETMALVKLYIEPLLARGVDTFVLGCTHYPLLRPLIEEIAGSNITIIDTGPAVARQAERVAGRIAGAAETADNTPARTSGIVHLLTTGGADEAYPARASLFLGDAAREIRPGRLAWKQGELYDNGGNEPE